METFVYDSRLAICKTPFGAVRTGEQVKFRIYLPLNMVVDHPVLKIFAADEWDNSLDIPLEFCSSNSSTSCFCATFTPQKPQLLFYCFSFKREGEVLEIKRQWNGSGAINSDGELWQLTVYDSAQKGTKVLGKGIIYQIFPDRFYNSGTPKNDSRTDRILHQDWGGMPEWKPNAQGEITNSDFFQGDLQGILSKLDYLVSLGVSAIYLNPIFKSYSNHRYDTGNYREVDPLLGSYEDFQQLCVAAKEKGIAIILDGVFSHTGADSLYFNRYKHYGEDGAYNNPDSEYYPWYQFIDYPNEYESWWGFESLPTVNKTLPDYLDYICGEKGVLEYWLEAGADGYRLDVADELPDIFLDQLGERVKKVKPEGIVFGEVWEDASNKISYGVRRRYLLGGQLDSVMNYPLKDGLLDYLRTGNYQGFHQMIYQILENYPPHVIYNLMNSLSTHDTPRAITVLGGEPYQGQDRTWQAEHHQLSPQQYKLGRDRFALGSIVQYGLPGVPTVYYGDESGLCGYKDPFNRVCYPWGKEDKGLVDFLRILGQIRTDYSFYHRGDFLPLVFNENLMIFLRGTGDLGVIFAINRSESIQKISLPFPKERLSLLCHYGCFQEGELGGLSGAILLVKKREV